jgi:energy-converting hydrogenase Eha subunit C
VSIAIVNNSLDVHLKRYLVAVGMLISGILAVAGIVCLIPSTQSLPVAISTSQLQPSEFYTVTTSQGGATLTEVLVNTNFQFRSADLQSASSTLDLAQMNQMAFLFVIAIVVGIWAIVLGVSSSHKDQGAFV